jgi:hypothetical protein
MIFIKEKNMLYNQIYICEKCKNHFYNEAECAEHEKHCGDDKFLVYRHILAFDDPEMTKIVIVSTKYNAKWNIKDKVIDLIPEYHDSDKFLCLAETNLDEIYYKEHLNIFYFYTMHDLNKDDYIEKLVNYAEKYFYKQEEIIANRRKNIIEKYVTKDFKFIDGFAKEMSFYY